MVSLGNRLREERKSRHLSLEEASRLLNVSFSTLAMYERDERTPPTDKLQQLADFYGVSVDYLLGRIDVSSRLVMRDAPAPYDPDLAARWPHLSPDRRQRAAEMEREAEAAGVETDVGPPDITNEEFDSLIREAAFYTAFILERAKKRKATE